MRAIISYLFLSFLLLCGGNYLYADTHHSPTSYSFSHNFEKQQKLKHKNTNQRSLLIESDDDDLDDEFQTSDKLNNSSVNKFLAAKQNVFNNWHSTFTSPLVLKNYFKSIKMFAPFCGQTNPIYIRQSVLRI